MLETFGKRLRESRQEQGLSAKELSQKAGVNIQTLYGYEIYGNLPVLYNAVRLADALGVSLDWLTGREGNA